ncbi:hypothetical protein [Spirosoma jeollabukense]
MKIVQTLSLTGPSRVDGLDQHTRPGGGPPGASDDQDEAVG